MEEAAKVFEHLIIFQLHSSANFVVTSYSLRLGLAEMAFELSGVRLETVRYTLCYRSYLALFVIEVIVLWLILLVVPVAIVRLLLFHLSRSRNRCRNYSPMRAAG